MTRVTHNYDRFSFFDENRPITKRKDLLKKIKERDMTPCYPILAWFDKSISKYLIVDGQHRYSCCKELDLPIYYTEFEGSKEEALAFMASVNQTARNWTENDWLNYYIKLGYAPYEKLKSLMEFTKYSNIANAIMLFSNGATDSSHFKAGQLVDKSEHFCYVVDFAKNVLLSEDVEGCRHTRPFTLAILRLTCKYGENSRQMNKLFGRLIEMKYKLHGLDDYVNLFEAMIRKR